MSGAKKNDEGKADLSAIPYCAMIAEAEAFSVGRKKYGQFNYVHGMAVTRIMSALLRHAFAYLNGEERDPTDGQKHLGAVKACASMILRQEELGTLIDDRYKPAPSPTVETVSGTLTFSNTYPASGYDIAASNSMSHYNVGSLVNRVDLGKAMSASACGEMATDVSKKGEE